MPKHEVTELQQNQVLLAKQQIRSCRMKCILQMNVRERGRLLNFLGDFQYGIIGMRFAQKPSSHR